MCIRDRSYIHVDDLARLLLDLTHAGEASRGRIFEPDDGRRGGWSHQEMAREIGRAMRRRVWAPSLPARVLAGAARIDRAVRGTKAKLTPDRARYMAHPNWVSDREKQVPDTVWIPSIDLPTGLVATANWYRQNGWLNGS